MMAQFMESTTEKSHSESVPSKLNGENIAGAGFLFFSFLFMLGGKFNAVFAVLYPVDYILVAVGVALVFLGYRTYKSRMQELTPGAKPASRY